MKDSEESFILVKNIKWPEYKKQKLKGAGSSAPWVACQEVCPAQFLEKLRNANNLDRLTAPEDN